MIATGARTTPIIEIYPPHKNPPLETLNKESESDMCNPVLQQWCASTPGEAAPANVLQTPLGKNPRLKNLWKTYSHTKSHYHYTEIGH